MGKKNKGGGANLGRALIKDRFGGPRNRKFVDDSSMLHTTEIQDGYDWGRLNLQSVTEESSFQEFLSTAELAGTEFQAEKLNIKFVNPRLNVGLLTKDEMLQAKTEHSKYLDVIKIPRRPPWTSQTTAEELQTNERESFLEWRRSLAMLQEEQGLLLTPYEKNLEFWRQLWRVVEKSDVVVQIVDARNPLLFRCEDLEKYVKEVSGDKINLVLVNKADFLGNEQRRKWAEYFACIGVRVAFFSALVVEKEEEDIVEKVDGDNSEDDGFSEDEDDYLEDTADTKNDENKVEPIENVEEEGKQTAEELKDSVNRVEEIKNVQGHSERTVEEIKDSFKRLEEAVDRAAERLEEISKEIKHRIEITDSSTKSREASDDLQNLESVDQIISDSLETNQIPDTLSQSLDVGPSQQNNCSIVNSDVLLSREDLIELFRTIHVGPKVTPGVTTIGLVGYPNVGKSSTINALMTVKKVSVSATPGKTKHFQTLFLDKDILLCDCPGLVMPSFVFTKAEMVLNGILPIDQMRDHVPPVNLVCNLIPRHVMEDMYGIMLPPPMEGEDEDRPPTSEELLNAYGYNRGFMTANGQPDNPRSARYVLKDFMNGKLLYAHAPPNIEQSEFHTWPEKQKSTSKNHVQPPREVRASRSNKMTTEDLDKMFFRTSHQGIHVQGKPMGIPSLSGSVPSVMEGPSVGKPWKKINRHENKNKREKLRRVYAHLDQH